MAPYRTPLFDEVSLISDFEVLYLLREDSSRLWDQSSQSLNHKYRFCDGRKVTITISGKKLSVNFSALHELINSDFDVVLLLDDPENIITMFILLFVAKLKRKKVVLISPRYSYYVNASDSVLSKIFKLGIDVFRVPMYIFSDVVWTYSEHTAKLVSRFKSAGKIFSGFQGYPETLVPNVVINEDLISKRYNSKSIVFVGYISERKGVDILVEAINEFRRLTKKNIRLKLIGTGADKYLSYDWIDIAGYVSGREKFDLMGESMFLCLPSHSDCWGWVVQEAQSIGLPVVTTKQVISSESLPSSKFVYDSSSVEQLVSLLVEIFTLDIDEYTTWVLESKRASNSHTQRKFIESFKEVAKNL